MKDKNDDIAITKIKRLFEFDREKGLLHPKLFLVQQCTLASCFAGFVIGGRIGARVGAVEHIETTKLMVYDSPTHAHRIYHARAIMGFMKNGCKFGWRAGVFAGFYSLVTVALSEVNSYNDSVNMVAAGAVAGIVYKSLSGWRNMLVGAVIGIGLSAPCAALIEFTRLALPDDMKEELNLFRHFKLPNEQDTRSDAVSTAVQFFENLESSIDDCKDLDDLKNVKINNESVEQES